MIRVERAWDVKAGVVETKSDAGRRAVPIAKVLRDHLVAHKLRSDHSDGLVFGRTSDDPFKSTSLRERALRAWSRTCGCGHLARSHDGERCDTDSCACDRFTALKPIGLHECRHTFASLMIAAGVNAKTLSVFMGHSSTTICIDRYGHLFPGSENEAAVLLDAYLEQAARRS